MCLYLSLSQFSERRQGPINLFHWVSNKYWRPCLMSRPNSPVRCKRNFGKQIHSNLATSYVFVHHNTHLLIGVDCPKNFWAFFIHPTVSSSDHDINLKATPNRKSLFSAGRGLQSDVLVQEFLAITPFYFPNCLFGDGT